MGALDGVVHAIGYAPDSCLGNGVLVSGWKDVAMAIEVSAYSLKVLAAAFAPLLSKAAGGGSIVGFDFDATVAWPGYDWMGVAKAALESLARYLARDMGPNASGSTSSRRPISTVAARSIPSFERFESVWDARARSAGTFATPKQSHEPAWRSCRTGSRGQPGDHPR